MSRRFLVAGGGGFIGSHLCRRLIERGDHVLCVDSLLTGDGANLADLARHPRFVFLRHDVVEPLGGRFAVDVVVNLASAASPPHYQADPVHTLMTNVLGTYHLLELAVRAEARFVLASTSEVYGDPSRHPQPESYNGNVNPIGPRACYDEAKRCAETLSYDYHRTRGVDVRVARIFNTYGPRMRADDGRVVSNVICQALRGADVTIYGEGSQTRSFCYVDDLVAGLVMLADHGGPIDGPINLGNPDEVTVSALARRVLALTGGRSRLVHLPLPVDDPKRRRPDITRARTLLGWRPRTALGKGLRPTIAWFASCLEADAVAAATAPG
jgi:UDP-glucuronate decarboxylase